MNEDREGRIRDLLPLVRKVARRVQRIVPSSDMDDLIGDGCIGLIRAADNFDPTRGSSLKRYASEVIAGAMLNGLRRLDPVSERVRREVRDAERERYALASKTGILPTQVEMEARRPALRRAAVHAHRYTPLSLDTPLPKGERLRADRFADPALIAAEHNDKERLGAALDRLPLRQRSVLSLHYFQGQSLRQIGQTLAISPQRASQLHLAALRNLRKVIHATH